MAEDDANKNGGFSFENSQEENDEEIDFTFSDIPVLGKDEQDRRKNFSFDSFNPSKVESLGEVEEELPDEDEHIESFKKLLLDEEPSQSEEEKPADVLSEQDIKKKKEKWEKIAKNKRRDVRKIKKLVALVASIVLFGISGILAFFLFKSEISEKRPDLSKREVSPHKILSKKEKRGGKKKSKSVVKHKSGVNKGDKTKEKEKQERLAKNGKQEGKEKSAQRGNTDKQAEKASTLTKSSGGNEKNIVLKKNKKVKKPEPEELTEEEIERLRKQRLVKKETERIFKEVRVILAKGNLRDSNKKDSKYISELKELTLKLFKLHPDNVETQRKLQDLLIGKIAPEDFLNIYLACYDTYKTSVPALFCYARALGTIPPAEKYLKRLINCAPKLKTPYMALGKLYIYMRKWQKAIDIYNLYLHTVGDDFAVRFLITETKLRMKAIQTPIIELENYLIERKTPKAQIGLKLITLAQRLRQRSLADRYLAYIKSDSKLIDKYRFYTLVNKALYGKLTENDFLPWYPEDARKIYILFLLSKRRYMDIQLLPTPPDKFPDFWKIYIGWLSKKDTLWKEEAKLLIKKYAFKSDKTYSIIASLWLRRRDKNGKVFSPKTARQFLFYVHPDNEPLFYFMLGEIYRKKRNRTRSKIMYAKALKKRQSIYYFMIKRRTKYY